MITQTRNLHLSMTNKLVHHKERFSIFLEQKYSTLETIAISYFKQKKQDTVTQKKQERTCGNLPSLSAEEGVLKILSNISSIYHFNITLNHPTLIHVNDQ